MVYEFRTAHGHLGGRLDRAASGVRATFSAMAKPICVHCQERPGDTRDYVFPDAWYPTTTPTTVQRWTVPCCRPCNERLHRAEDAIGLDLLLICMMDRPEIADVQEKICTTSKLEQS
jgi:hypothetical protein